MADPIEFAGFNRVYMPAPGTEDRVRPMHGFTNGHEVISCWKLSDLEKAAVTETGEVWVSMMSGPQPVPVLISGVPLMSLIDENGQPTGGYRSDMDLGVPQLDPEHERNLAAQAQELVDQALAHPPVEP